MELTRTKESYRKLTGTNEKFKRTKGEVESTKGILYVASCL